MAFVRSMYAVSNDHGPALYQMNTGTLLAGHPSVIVDALKRAMTLSLFEGLYQTLKGAGNLAMTATGAGAVASLVVSVVIALAEMAIKMIWRMVELARMDKFFARAK